MCVLWVAEIKYACMYVSLGVLVQTINENKKKKLLKSRQRLLRLPAQYAVQGLCNGRVSVRPSIRPSVYPVDRHLQLAAPAYR